MNTFNRKSLYAALAGLGALSGMGAAEAVNLAPEGLGQVADLSVLHGPQRGERLRLQHAAVGGQHDRLGEGRESAFPGRQELQGSARLQLVPVAQRRVDGDGCRSANGAAVQSDDNSCILPTQLPARARRVPESLRAAVRQLRVRTDGADSSLDRTREGYVEIIEMATFGDTSTTAILITHGARQDCAAEQRCAGYRRRAQPPTGGLFGGLTLINVFDGSAYSQDATALDHVFDSQLYNNAGDIGPTFNDTIAAGQHRRRRTVRRSITDWTVTTQCRSTR